MFPPNGAVKWAAKELSGFADPSSTAGWEVMVRIAVYGSSPLLSQAGYPDCVISAFDNSPVPNSWRSILALWTPPLVHV
jgi:hypothetical protein